MLLVNARLPFILGDVLYTCLLNGPGILTIRIYSIASDIRLPTHTLQQLKETEQDHKN